MVGKLLLGIAIVAWLIQSGRLDLEVYRGLFSSHGVVVVLAVFALQLVSFSIVIARWYLLTHVHGIRVSLGRVLLTGYQGLFANLVMPGSLGLDGVRLYHLHRYCRGQVAEGFASLLVDRVVGLAGMLLLAVMAGTVYWMAFSADWVALTVGAICVLTIVAGGITAGLFRVFQNHRTSSRRGLRGIMSVMEALRMYRGHMDSILWSLMISVAGHLLTGIAWFVAMSALGYQVPISAVIFLTSLLLVLRSIPTTPLGLGVTDGAAEILYQLIGNPAGAELQMLMRVISMSVFLLGGFAFFSNRPGSAA